MNRTIKFRGKRIDNGQWVYGFLAEDYYINDVNSQDFPSIEIAPETVGQFTGLFAADGHEIYENDLVECAGILCEIVYNEYIGSFVLLEVLSQCLGNEAIRKMQDMFGFSYKGNIHDNPELLSSKE